MALTISGCALGNSDMTRTRNLNESASSSPASRVEPYVYDYDGTRVEGELIRISVPQSYSDPDGQKIELAFVRLKSTAAQPGPPVIYLAGGPGGSGINLAKGPRGRSFLLMRQAGDIILLDQRGTGLSRPNLDCPGQIDLPPSVTRIEAIDALMGASRACAAFWRGRGVDLGAYNVVESAHDVDAVRRAIGAEKVILWASSYGTQLGFAVIRHHGGGIARGVFSGVEGPDHSLKLPGIIERQFLSLDKLLRNDSRFRSNHSDMLSLARHVLDSADRQPFLVTALGGDGSPGTVIPLRRFDLERMIVGMIGTRGGLAYLPATLAAFERHDLSSPYVQAAAREALSTRSGSIGSAMAYATDCASGSSSQRRALIAREARTALITDLDFPIPEICPIWNVPELPAPERTLVQSRIPILLLSGTLDGQTPAQNAIEVLTGFPNGHHVFLDGSGHGNDLFVGAPEIEAVTLAFIQSGRVTAERILLPPLEIR